MTETEQSIYNLMAEYCYDRLKEDVAIDMLMRIWERYISKHNDTPPIIVL